MTMEHWLRYVCNRPTRAQNTAITETEWEKAKTTDEIPAKEPIWVGLDVAWKWDTTAIVPLWPRDKEYRLFGPATVLVPPRDGTMLDGRKIEAAFVEIHARNPIHTVVMDMSSAESLAQWLESELGAVVIDRSQTITWAVRDYERFMEALRNGWLKHSGDAGLTSHVLNAIAHGLPRGDTVFERPSQTRQSAEQDRRVIDALTAASMVHGMAAAAFDAPEPVKSRVAMSWS
jgi:phage terminase large subunit-like protein